ncbi:MAG: ADP-forming succinate--CoA ligase subunit beta [Bacteroidales bacterium]
MKIHEFQAKELFEQYAIPTVRGKICTDQEAAVLAYSEIKPNAAVIKAQVLTGGRGKAGGVKIANNEEELRQKTNEILGMNIKGNIVNKVMIVPAYPIKNECYLGMTIDRNKRCVIVITSKAGGVEIEEIAAFAPQKINRYLIDASIGIPDFKARNIALSLFNQIDQIKQTAHIIQNMYRLMLEKDASLIEINPLIEDDKGIIIALDGKMTFDDNALFKHPDIAHLAEPSEEEIKENEAKAKGFSYIQLTGSIGCMVNGAGLAMATLDLIKLYGGEPANFLDIGGSSNPQKVIEAMQLLTSDPKVKVILINIFGGITRCDDVANGLIETFKQIKTNLPIVIRLTGTNEEEGNKIIADSEFIRSEDMTQAIQKAVELSKI